MTTTMKSLLLLSFLLVLISPVWAGDTRAIALLLDISKSIPAGDFEKAKDQIVQIVDRASPSDTISLYAFGNAVRKLDLNGLKNVRLTDSHTMLYDAVYDAAQDLAGTAADRKAIVIISDGNDTKSVTVLEDTVSFANDSGIAVYGVGAGKANRKTLERIAKLTGGRYFELGQRELTERINQSLAAQKPVAIQEKPAQPSVSSQPAVVLPPATSQLEDKGFPWARVLAVLGLAALFILGVTIAVRMRRAQPRTCPTCGRKMEPYQTVCPVCSAPKPATEPRAPTPSDGTQEILTSVEQEEAPIPLELLEKKPVTEEMLSRTFVLMETPMLVVRKGKNSGQSFSLNRAFPVSIGRSRVNEIHVDDVTVSGQHCRIIPENGKHVLYDLGSTNGTFVNDSRVQRAVLKEGDIVKVGETHFLYKIEQHRT